MGTPSLFTAMITPFDANGNVDYERARSIVTHLLANGSEGLVVAGTTGEAPTLSDEEKLSLFRTVISEVKGRVPVYAGTGSNCTRHSIELTREAEKIGVDGILAVAPYYNKPSQEGLYHHFKSIAEATSLPVMVYNIPGRTGVNVLPETIRRLSEIPNITSVKEASGSLDQVSFIRSLTKPDFMIYCGDDSLTLPMLAVGACGVVSIASHLVGQEILQMLTLFKQGKIDEATKIHLRLLKIFKVLFINTNPVPLKAALKMLGLDTGVVRLPLFEVNVSEREQIKSVLLEMGFVLKSDV